MRNLLILSFIVVPFALNAQKVTTAFIKYFNECINIYQQPVGHEVEAKIFQDSINETNYYNVLLLEKSPLRFKVRLQAYDSSPYFEGWIDKECIAVYPRNGEVLLYTEPTINSPVQHFKDITQLLTVIDYEGKWLKVYFIINDKPYCGWIKEYCPNIYNSCS